MATPEKRSPDRIEALRLEAAVFGGVDVDAWTGDDPESLVPVRSPRRPPARSGAIALPEPDEPEQ